MIVMNDYFNYTAKLPVQSIEILHTKQRNREEYILNVNFLKEKGKKGKSSKKLIKYFYA